jgi:mRNA interferase MazF
LKLIVNLRAWQARRMHSMTKCSSMQVRRTGIEAGRNLVCGRGSSYVGKPRPVVIVQDDRFAATDSVTICAFTTDPTEAPLIRLVVQPHPSNGLREVSSLLVDKVTTVPRNRLDERIGRLGDEDLVRLGRDMVVFLGLAGQ